MATIQNIQLYDGAPTPVQHTYAPHEDSPNGGLVLADRSNANPLLWWTLAIDRPVPKKGALTRQFIVTANVPYEETNGSTTTIKYVMCRMVMYAPPGAAVQVRKNARMIMKNALMDAQVIDVLDNGAAFIG